MELFVIWQKVSLGWRVGLVLLPFKIFLCGRISAVGWGHPAIVTSQYKSDKIGLSRPFSGV